MEICVPVLIARLGCEGTTTGWQLALVGGIVAGSVAVSPMQPGGKKRRGRVRAAIIVICCRWRKRYGQSHTLAFDYCISL